MQLVSTTGACWTARFDSGGIDTNGTGEFRATP
jgi:hypothetical protein